MKNLPKKEIPHKNSSIVNIKTSVAIKSDHWSENLVGNRSFVRYQDGKCYPLLLKAFEDNGGYVVTNKLDEIEAVIGGELTREQISKWFQRRRIKCGILSRKNTKLSKRAKSVHSHVFAKNSGYCDGEELDELEERLGGENTRK